MYLIIISHPAHGMFRELRQADIRYFGYHSVPMISYVHASTSQEPMYIHTSMTSHTCCIMPAHADVGESVANAPASHHVFNSFSAGAFQPDALATPQRVIAENSAFSEVPASPFPPAPL